jgi:hypothetical protein
MPFKVFYIYFHHTSHSSHSHCGGRQRPPLRHLQVPGVRLLAGAMAVKLTAMDPDAGSLTLNITTLPSCVVATLCCCEVATLCLMCWTRTTPPRW